LARSQSYLIPQLGKISSLAALASQMKKLLMPLRNLMRGSSSTTNQREFTCMWEQQEVKFLEARSKG
jgi:hypothetical protein